MQILRWIALSKFDLIPVSFFLFFFLYVYRKPSGGGFFYRASRGARGFLSRGETLSAGVRVYRISVERGLCARVSRQDTLERFLQRNKLKPKPLDPIFLGIKSFGGVYYLSFYIG